MNLKKYTGVVLVALALATSSCTEWLDVDPVSEIGADQLFETKQGFDVAINGIYMTLASQELYGGELNYGATELMARSLISASNTDIAFMDHDYEYSGALGRISAIWSKSYNLVANCNKFLEELEKKDDHFFAKYEYEQYRGQALAARALTYFNLVRLFAPYHLREDVAVLPYTTSLSPVAGPKLLTSAIVDSVIVDLKLSRDLLAGMDTLDATALEMKTRSLRFTYSLTGGEKAIGFRFNQMAVTALLARVAMWNGDSDLAYAMAYEAYSKWGVQPELKANITNGKHDRLLSYGLFMGLYTGQLNQYYDTGINADMHYVNNIGDLYPELPTLDGDYRYSKLIKEVSTGNYQYLKYTDEDLSNGIVVNMVPVVRIAEMIYIVAETLYDTNPANALYWVNWLRQRRGTAASYCPTSMPDKEAFMEYLVGEVRKEFIGEGQLFFYYKRMNMPVKDKAVFGAAGKTMSESDFTWPIPDSEFVN